MLGQEEGLLCHGEVFNPKTGRFHGHCWIETHHTVSDIIWCRDIHNGLDMTLPKGLYYSRGRVRRVKRYTAAQANKMLVEFGHYGPWKPS
jgi:hypothetical protein